MSEKLIRVRDIQKFLGRSRSFAMELLRKMKAKGDNNVVFNPELRLYGVLDFDVFINNIKGNEICERSNYINEAINTTLTSPLIPFMSFKFKKELKDYSIRDRILALEEIDKLLNNSSEDLKRLIIFLLETCMRINEALNIQFTDIATDQRTNIQYIRIRKEITKNKKERYNLL